MFSGGPVGVRREKREEEKITGLIKDDQKIYIHKETH
jgi:hypothetical protein